MGFAPEERSRWLDHLFSTRPADRPRAEAAVLALYRFAGFEEPRYFLWFDSPFQASRTVALLLAEHHPAWRQARANLERSARGREAHLRLHTELCRTLAEPDWAGVVEAVGRPMDPRWLRGQDLARTLQSALIAARLAVCKDPAALYAGYDEDDDLSRAEAYLWGPARGVLVTQRTLGVAQSLIAASFYTIYSYVMMASDQALGEGAPPPPLIAAAWEIARSAGPWWPFSHAAVLTERPLEIHLNEKWLLHREDGPAAVYRDGARVYAFNGKSLPADWILHPEKIREPRLRKRDPAFRKFVTSRISAARPSLFSRELPRDPQDRLDWLRERAGGRLPLFDRYNSGRHRQVWREIVALGPDVRNEPLAADALAVAYEVMHRVEANVRTVLERLHTLGYRFRSGLPAAKAAAASAHSHQPADQIRPGAHLPPGPKVWEQIQRLEKHAGLLPLSLRAFYDVVGAVDFTGSHPRLSHSRPLHVLSAEQVLAKMEGASGAPRQAILISPGTGDQGAYRIAVPNPGADGELLDEPHGLLFVDYLRLCFRFGGFPAAGAVASVPPPEIARLREGLIEF
jgi:uncharacterized protein DUF6745